MGLSNAEVLLSSLLLCIHNTVHDHTKLSDASPVAG